MESKEYHVNIKRVEYGSVIVEALTKEEAEQKAWEAYEDGNVDWNKEDPAIENVELV